MEIGGDTKETEGPTVHDPPGTERDLGTGQGWQGGGERMRDTATEAGTQRGAQRRAAEAGGWRVETKYRWTTYHSGRGCGERVR